MAAPDQPVLLIRRAEVDGRRVDVRVEGSRIAAVGTDLPTTGVEVVDAAGGALLPGLHDHHLHLLAMAAARRSLDLAGEGDGAAFDAAIQAAHGSLDAGRWLRIVGVDDRHGTVDRNRLDALAPDRPVRAQHRSGAAWILNRAALAAVGATAEDGWIHGDDAELGRRWADPDPPDLAPVAAQLAAFGVTGVTDATPYDDPSALHAIADAHRAGALPQRVLATGGLVIAATPTPEPLERGPVKLVVGDHELPSLADLASAITRAHRAGRPVAVHCVTRVALVLALAAWSEVGAVAGDRIEHASVVPVELIETIASLGLRVVTQPGFVHAHGDRYLRDVEPEDVDHLYRCGSLVAAGIPLGLSTDAPFGPADPWLVIAAAADRRTAGGASLGADEALAAADALRGFLGAPDDPGGRPRTIRRGAPADLCLLDRPLDAALRAPSADHVRATWIAGQLATG